MSDIKMARRKIFCYLGSLGLLWTSTVLLFLLFYDGFTFRLLTVDSHVSPRRDVPRDARHMIIYPHLLLESANNSKLSDLMRSAPVFTSANYRDVQTSAVNANPAVQFERNKDQKPPLLRYLLALSYEEQLSAATRSMFQLAPLAADWNAQLVEPTVVNSNLFGIRGLVPSHLERCEKDAIRLFDLYDRTRLHELLHERLSPNLNMVPLEDFILSASQNITILHFNVHNSPARNFGLSKDEVTHISNQLKMKQLAGNSIVLDCSKVPGASNLARRLEKRLNAIHLKLHNGAVGSNFTVLRSLCLNQKSTYHSQRLLKHISHSATIIFSTWRGCGSGACSYLHREQELPSNPSPFRFDILTENRFHPPGSISVEQFHILQHASIQRTAQLYLEAVGIRKPFISVHIRTEKLLIDGINWRCCLSTLANLVSPWKLHQKLLVTDSASVYGTFGCRGHGICNPNITKAIVSTLRSFNFTTNSYDPSLLNGTRNSGYVSLVEMNMLSLGYKLVLLGRGGFQLTLKSLYLSRNDHKETDIYHICSADDTKCIS